MCTIGLVTVLFNSDSVLDGFFQSLSAQTFKDYHLYIIDNSPCTQTDNLINTLADKYPVTAYTHIKNDKNEGVAKGNNQGIKLSIKSTASHTLLLNNDIEFREPDLLQIMFNKAVQNNERLIIPKILYYDTNKIWMAGGQMIPYKGIIRHIGDNKECDDTNFNQATYFDYAPTCFMLVNNIIFEQIGLMDEKYFVYYDDTDFVYRAVKAGNKIYYMPNLIVLHKVSSSTGGSESPFSVYYSNRNRLYFIRKNLTGIKYLSAMAFSLSTRAIKLFKGGWQERKNLYKAITDGLKMDFR